MRLALSIAGVIVALATCADARAADDSLFRDKVAPILERHCVSCHQGDSPKGGLALTSAKGAFAGADSGAVIEPGKPDESRLVEVISGEKPEMPQKARPLSKDEVAAIRQWIAEGARWTEGLLLVDKKLAGADDDWWSLRPIVRQAVPDVKSEWARTPIDAFIYAKLQALGLRPSAEADRRTLIRRVTFDLHGLPPTPEEFEAFLNDKSPDAYEQLVDRLLESPRYGERWGRHWLDVVHFGESHGYDKDKPRPNAWPYRDYVIAAFNSDKPYRRFVEEQLAGDVLYPDDPQATVATGFIAAGPWDFVGHVELREGTIDKKITRSNDRDDMVATAMSTFVSQTVHCARCHNHKFDPISQEDYYKLQAVFAGVDRVDRPFDADSETHRTRRTLAHEREALAARQQELAEKVAQVTSPGIRETDQRLEKLKREIEALPKANEGEASPTNGYHSAIEATPDATKWVQVDLGKSLPLEQIILVPARPTDFPDTPGFGFPQRFRVEISEDPKFGASVVLVDHTADDFANPGDKPVIIDAKDRPARCIRVTAKKLWKRTNDFVFALAELQALSKSTNVAPGGSVTALDSIEAGRWSTKHLVDNYSSRARLGDLKALAAATARREQLEKSSAELASSRKRLVDALLDAATREEIKSLGERIAAIDEGLSELPAPQLVYAAANRFAPQGSFVPATTPRTVYFLPRGNDKTPGAEMSPGALACIARLPADFKLANADDEGARRAALAKWIVDPQNPLTRRSIVNRVWQYHFGRGIVDTPNDFGHMGALPTHPELLDWLAAELAEATDSAPLWMRGAGQEATGATSTNSATPPDPPLQRGGGAWSLKRLHKLILMSSVYRQSSRNDAENAAVDSSNQFLWRQNRQRMEAESIRDATLFVAGRLDLRMGGPSDQQFFFKDDHSPVYDYGRFDVDSPAGQRRSVYRFIVRSVPDPFMECLDCADPSLLTPRRNTTLTALQALSLLNNQFMVRQAEHFAERLRKISDDPARQITAAYRLALGRDPRPAETAKLTDYATRHGLANACRVILNSNEYVFVD